ncbi:RNA-directed DNA polymerase from mobile element jockey [Trichonephila clavipes]|nr:RNA-directed DNA polymerase from mobile element jockey [Trichonephila clavipes]
MATGSFMSHNYSSSQSEVPRDYHKLTGFSPPLDQSEAAYRKVVLSSPLLFTLYVNDISKTDLSHLAMFADDTAVITQNKRFSVVISNLQHYISLLELWLTDWKIKVNASKSACLIFTRRSHYPLV